MKSNLILFEEASNNLVEEFIKKYFGSASDVWWIGDEVGYGVLGINDYFFGIDIIIQALKFKATKKQLFGYYDLSLEYAEKGKKMEINFKTYLFIS